ncbi:MAG TPA: nucleotide sugar dehydrogenase [Acidimicrobiales bacterium]|nr:nucleotide sugar dehydrogenase [Acidimicrobiales bacterium]
MNPNGFERDVVVVGGCGHVGLPLGLALADAGLSVVLYDIAALTVERVAAGEMPFVEPGTEEILRRVIGDRLTVTTDPAAVSSAEYVVVVIGTPVDEHLNPDPMVVSVAVEELADHLVDGQVMVLRSTVFPGTTAVVEKILAHLGRRIEVAFCPERIAEGRAIEELRELPQIVASRTEDGYRRTEALFAHLTERTVRVSPEEAELAKLFTNSWRYLKFAIANQFFMIANDFGVDYERVRSAVRYEYPRAADLPGAGFAAGPCLLKDTMQLAAFNNNNFVLGHSAMLVNEGLPLYIVSKLEERFPLAEMTVGILGMAFKAGSDDTRSSLSYKLKRILKFRARHVVCHDPYVTTDPELSALEDVVKQADLLIVGAPHAQYAALETEVPLVDVTGSGGRSVAL